MNNSTPHSSALKVCTKCGQAKPATTEYFHRGTGKRDGLESNCKECRAKTSLAYYEATKENQRERRRAYSRAYREANRSRTREAFRAYYAVNREKRKQYMRAWRKANPGRTQKTARAWRKANRDHQREYTRAYRKANPESVRANTYRRRARKVSAEGAHTAADIQVQYGRQKGKCYYCGVKVGDSYHVDHVIPLSRGGSNGPENIVIACPSCNTSKSDRLPHEWPQGGRLL